MIKSITTTAPIEKLLERFDRHTVPATIVTDNGRETKWCPTHSHKPVPSGKHPGIHHTRQQDDLWQNYLSEEDNRHC
ncbi:hypothetical protein T03_15570 [Trichinella britovi]|uniref:Uncharacterized protein n=1 Tax=Trichinella britovi TaxID=45882 RepID=A0A0V1CW21_TRIBR|nr:hypothetical protein T03_15570 [Trichinella britovi]